MLSKNVNNKKCAPKLIFFNEKKIEKDSDNFWCTKLTLKVGRLGDFAHFDTSPLVQLSKFKNFLWLCWFLGKTLSNFIPSVWKLHNPYCHNAECRLINKSRNVWPIETVYKTVPIDQVNCFHKIISTYYVGSDSRHCFTNSNLFVGGLQLKVKIFV